jgi:hypothetical protein
MQRDEMTDEQLRIRDSIADRLSKAGWSPTRRQVMFDEGRWTLHEVSMERIRDGRGLQLVLDTEQGRIGLTIRRNAFQGLTVYIFHAGCLEPLLDVVVRHQDSVDEENFRELIREIVSICPETYTAEDEDSPLRKVVP